MKTRLLALVILVSVIHYAISGLQALKTAMTAMGVN